MTEKLIPKMADLEEAACETFQWDIKDWRSLDKRVTGPEFEIGGYKWQVSGGGVLGFLCNCGTRDTRFAWLSWHAVHAVSCELGLVLFGRVMLSLAN